MVHALILIFQVMKTMKYDAQNWQNHSLTLLNIGKMWPMAAFFPQKRPELQHFCGVPATNNLPRYLNQLITCHYACSGDQYHKGTSIQQVLEFGTSKHNGKAHGILSQGWMICNDTVCCWPITSSNVFIFDHNYSVEGGLKLKVIDCIVQSAEYWCLYGNFHLLE